MADQYAVQCSGLFHVYPDGTEALKKVTLNLKKGNIHVIVGPNGAGKTTFLRIATTEFLPTEGSISILRYDVCRNRETVTRLIGVMPRQAGIRDRVLLIVSGPRISHKLAIELGYDAGFGPGTLPWDVGSFIATEVAKQFVTGRAKSTV